MQREGGGKWEVTAVAPAFLRGDLHPVFLEKEVGELCRLESVPARLTGQMHCFFYARRLREVMKASFDLVHCWEEPYILAGAQVALRTNLKTPLVFATFQNLVKNYPPPFNLVEKFSLNRTAAWIAFGHTVLNAMRDRAGYREKPHRVIPPGVDVEKFRPDPEGRKRMRVSLGWDSEVPVIGYLGRLAPEKGLGLLLNVLEKLASPWRALFVGSGPMERPIRKWAAKFNDQVRILTNVRHADVPGYLNVMDVLCAPSQTTKRWQEQFGRMLIEAFACRVPVVASNSGEIPFVVEDAGLILPEDDEAAWVTALEEVIANETLRSELSARGLERVHRLYTWPIIARQHLNFFLNVLDAQGSR